MGCLCPSGATPPQQLPPASPPLRGPSPLSGECETPTTTSSSSPTTTTMMAESGAAGAGGLRVEEVLARTGFFAGLSLEAAGMLAKLAIVVAPTTVAAAATTTTTMTGSSSSRSGQYTRTGIGMSVLDQLKNEMQVGMLLGVEDDEVEEVEKGGTVISRLRQRRTTTATMSSASGRGVLEEMEGALKGHQKMTRREIAVASAGSPLSLFLARDAIIIGVVDVRSKDGVHLLSTRTDIVGEVYLFPDLSEAVLQSQNQQPSQKQQSKNRKVLEQDRINLDNQGLKEGAISPPPPPPLELDGLESTKEYPLTRTNSRGSHAAAAASARPLVAAALPEEVKIGVKSLPQITLDTSSGTSTADSVPSKSFEYLIKYSIHSEKVIVIPRSAVLEVASMDPKFANYLQTNLKKRALVRSLGLFKKIGVFSKFSTSEIFALMELFDYVPLRKGEVVLTSSVKSHPLAKGEDDSIREKNIKFNGASNIRSNEEAFIIVCEGKIEASSSNVGRFQIFREGDWFGEACLLRVDQDNHDRLQTSSVPSMEVTTKQTGESPGREQFMDVVVYTAVEDGVVLRLKAKSFQTFVRYILGISSRRSLDIVRQSRLPVSLRSFYPVFRLFPDQALLMLSETCSSKFLSLDEVVQEVGDDICKIRLKSERSSSVTSIDSATLIDPLSIQAPVVPSIVENTHIITASLISPPPQDGSVAAITQKKDEEEESTNGQSEASTAVAPVVSFSDVSLMDPVPERRRQKPHLTVIAKGSVAIFDEEKTFVEEKRVGDFLFPQGVLRDMEEVRDAIRKLEYSQAKERKQKNEPRFVQSERNKTEESKVDDSLVVTTPTSSDELNREALSGAENGVDDGEGEATEAEDTPLNSNSENFDTIPKTSRSSSLTSDGNISDRGDLLEEEDRMSRTSSVRVENGSPAMAPRSMLLQASNMAMLSPLSLSRAHSSPITTSTKASFSNEISLRKGNMRFQSILNEQPQSGIPPKIDFDQLQTRDSSSVNSNSPLSALKKALDIHGESIKEDSLTTAPPVMTKKLSNGSGVEDPSNQILSKEKSGREGDSLRPLAISMTSSGEQTASSSLGSGQKTGASFQVRTPVSGSSKRRLSERFSPASPGKVRKSLSQFVSGTLAMSSSKPLVPPTVARLRTLSFMNLSALAKGQGNGLGEARSLERTLIYIFPHYLVSSFLLRDTELQSDFEIKCLRRDCGFRNVLHHPIALKYFHQHLESQFALENLDFYLEAENFAHSTSSLGIDQSEAISTSMLRDGVGASITRIDSDGHIVHSKSFVKAGGNHQAATSSASLPLTDNSSSSGSRQTPAVGSASTRSKLSPPSQQPTSQRSPFQTTPPPLTRAASMFSRISTMLNLTHYSNGHTMTDGDSNTAGSGTRGLPLRISRGSSLIEPDESSEGKTLRVIGSKDSLLRSVGDGITPRRSFARDIDLGSINGGGSSPGSLRKMKSGSLVSMLSGSHHSASSSSIAALRKQKEEEEARKAMFVSVAAHARTIYTKYIAQSSPMQINIESATRSAIDAAMELDNNEELTRACIRLYHDAQDQVYTIMKRDAFPRFKKSELFPRMLQEVVGGNVNPTPTNNNNNNKEFGAGGTKKFRRRMTTSAWNTDSPTAAMPPLPSLDSPNLRKMRIFIKSSQEASHS